MPPEVCNVHRLGLVPYEEAWRLQGRLAREIAGGARGATLLLLEHPHTYTFGRRGQESNLLWNDSALRRRGVQVHWVDRGGDITYHGPGQLVGYPLIALGHGAQAAGPTDRQGRIPQGDFLAYLRALEATLILALARLGVAAHREPGLTGVWVADPAGSSTPAERPGRQAKVAAIGIKVDARGVSRHGFALNVDPDMSYWEGIIACGLHGHPVTSLASLLHPMPTMDQVVEAVATAFGETLGFILQEGAPLERQS